MHLTDATTITMSLAMLGTIAGGVSAWAVALYRLRQVEITIAELEEAKARGHQRQHDHEVRLALLEHRAAVPMLLPHDPTPIASPPPSPRS